MISPSKIGAVISNVNKYLMKPSLSKSPMYILRVTNTRCDNIQTILSERQLQICSYLKSHIDSNVITLQDIALYAVHHYMKTWELWTFKSKENIISEIKEIGLTFSEKNYIFNISKFDSIVKESKLADKDFFEITEDGSMMIMDLYQKNYIDAVLLANIVPILNDIVSNTNKFLNESFLEDYKCMVLFNTIIKGD